MQDRLQKIVLQMLEKKIFSAASILLGDSEKILFQASYGATSFSKHSEKIGNHSIFDLASLTKSLATSLAVFLLIEKKELALNTKIANFFDAFQSPPKDQITIFHLLNHTSGLPDWAPLFEQKNSKKAFQKLLETPLQNAVGSKVIYSCLGFMLLAKVVEKITGDFQKFCWDNFYKPLHLQHTYFHPFDSAELAAKNQQVVSTYKDSFQEYKAIAQDDNSRVFEGESGNSGLFSNAGDIYLIAKNLLANQNYQGIPFLQKQTIAKMWSLSTGIKQPHWALGWVYFQGEPDYCHCSPNMELGTVGHLGYTGTSLMIEPRRSRIYIILTNRVGNKKTAIAIKNFRRETQLLLAQRS